MLRYFAKSALLLGITVVVMCGVYPGVLWLIGQTVFPLPGERQHRAQCGRSGRRLDAGGAALHQGRIFPTAAVGGQFFDASASTSSAYAPSNYAYATAWRATIGPIATYGCRDKQGARCSGRRGFRSKPTRPAAIRTSSRNGPTPITVWRKAG